MANDVLQLADRIGIKATPLDDGKWFIQRSGFPARLATSDEDACSLIKEPCRGVFSISNEAYHADRAAVSRSVISAHIDDRRDAEWIFKGKMPDNDATPQHVLKGMVTHTLLLEGRNAFDRLYACADPKFKHKKQAGWKAESNAIAAAGKTALTVNEYNQCVAMTESVQRLLGKFLDQNPLNERSVYWVCPFSGLNCRCRPDMMVVTDDMVYVWDLKTSGQIGKHWFRRRCWDGRLWLQQAHYSIGIAQAYQRPVRFIFTFVKSTPSFTSRCFEIDPSDMVERRHEYVSTIRDVEKSIRLGNWTNDYEHEITPVSIGA